MAGLTAGNLLGEGGPSPFELYNAKGRSPFLLLGDHAGSALPACLEDLGLSAADRARHIAVDIGTYGLGLALADALDATFVHQTYSRLVIDCNRDPARADAIPIISDGSRIVGNEGLDGAARKARTAAIHSPYHEAIAAQIDHRRSDGRETILLSLHSFTPVLDGFVRPWTVGVLHWLGRTDFAKAMLSNLKSGERMCVGDNLPYQMDATDYTLPRHAFSRDLRYAEIEIRQDLIEDHQGQRLWADHVQRSAVAALSRLA